MSMNMDKLFINMMIDRVASVTKSRKQAKQIVNKYQNKIDLSSDTVQHYGPEFYADQIIDVEFPHVFA